VIARAGHTLERWRKGLVCMLEKILGIIIADKMQGIFAVGGRF